MEFFVFDVGHGNCSALIHPNGNIALFDAGSGGPNKFNPGAWLLSRGKLRPELLSIHNFDEDHISGITTFGDPITLLRNWSIKSDEVIALKRESDPFAPTQALKRALHLHDRYSAPAAVGARESDLFPGVEFYSYWNRWDQFYDTNNASLVTFILYYGTQICLPGDLEYEGWEALSQKQGFLSHLQATDILIAPHHGRTNGYHAACKHLCRFEAVIFSDSAQIYSTQLEASTYGQHVPFGVTFPNNQVRRVLSTRNDGHIRIAALPTGARGYWLKWPA